MILKWVNDNRNPDEVVAHKAVLGVPVKRQEATFYYMRLMKEQIRRAFETDDEYDRDWFLFVARWYNAILQAPGGPLIGSIPGVVPMAKDTIEDRVLALAQKHLASRMAVCKRCKQCYFRKYSPQVAKAQKYCPGECAMEAKRALNRNWYHESPNSPKNVFKQQLEQAGVRADKIEKLLNGESVRFDD